MTNNDFDNSREWAAQAYALLKKRQEEQKQELLKDEEQKQELLKDEEQKQELLKDEEQKQEVLKDEEQKQIFTDNNIIEKIFLIKLELLPILN